MISVLTTFSEEGYNVYGKRWIESYIKFWPSSSRAIIYTDFDLIVTDPRITIINFNQCFPGHERFKQIVTEKGKNYKTIKFSYKSFCMIRELDICTSDYLIWLDGDVETLDFIPEDYPKNIVQDHFIASQHENLKHGRVHVESGIVIFNLKHQQKDFFNDEFKEYYYNYKLLQMKKPYDGHVIGSIIIDNKIDHIDLNKDFNVIGVRDTPDTTFLHPVLKSKFIHRICGFKFRV